MLTGTPVGTALSAPPKPVADHRQPVAAGRQVEGVLQESGRQPEVPAGRRHRGGVGGHRRRSHRPRNPAHRPIRVTSARTFRRRSSAPDRPASPPPRCWRSTAWTAWSSTAGPACTRSRAPCTWTTKSTASSPGSASPTSSPRSRGPRSVCGCSTSDSGCSPSSPATPRAACNGFPQANMFDQPELEAVLRANLKRYPNAELRGDAEVTDVTEHGGRACASPSPTAATATMHLVDADYLLGCDGANSMVRAQIGSAMRDLNFEQRWLVVDVATDADLHQWEGVHQVCDPVRAGTYMRIGRGPLPVGVSAAGRRKRRRLRHPDRAAATDRAVDRRRCGQRTDAAARHRVHVPRANRRPVAPRQRLHPRRRRAPHSPVHRSGHGSRTARRDESRLEDRRGPRRHPGGRRSRQLRAGAQTAHPAADSAGAQCRPGDDRRRPARQRGAPLVLPRLRLHSRSARQGRRLHHAGAACVGVGAQISPTARARRARCARIRCCPTVNGSTTWSAPVSP